MTVRTRTWLLRLVKLAVCATAVAYLSTKVTLNDTVYLAADPDRRHVLLDAVADLNQLPRTLRIRDAETSAERTVSRDELATPEQLGRRRPIELGLKSIVRRTDLGWVGWALLVMTPITFVIGWRLRLLLSTQGIDLPMRDAVLLTFAGNFFNFAMPGTTGGDLYKAYHIAKRTHKRTEGVTVVLLDRVIGLISFLLLAAAAILVSWQKEVLGVYGRWVGYLMAAFFVFACLFFSRRVRRWIRYDALLGRLPLGDKLRRVDETAFNLRYHLGTTVRSLAITVVCHFFFISSIYALARGLHIPPRPDFDAADLYLAVLLATVVGYLFAAIPISFQGFGLLELVFLRVLVEGGWSNESQMLALTLGARLLQIIWALPGVIVPWLGLERPRGEAADANTNASAETDAASVTNAYG